MSHKAAKVGITGTVLALAFGGLLYTSLGESAEYYKHVDEVLASPQQWQGKKLQLHGFAHQIGRKRDALEYQFNVESNGKVIRAYYSGIVPDTFKEEAEVVLKGTLSPDGTFQVAPDGVIAKCPSKYSPQSGGPAGAE
jgi:cytochrome c-type biogenesis protein CcmE